jgi:hypothetical protein
MNPNKRDPMLTRLRQHLTYANVVASLALFVALGGSSYAALSITGSDVRDGSLTGRDIKRNSLTCRQIKEARLGTVRRARNAARLGGLTAQRLLLKCPAGTLPFADTCVENQARTPTAYGNAVIECGSVDSTRTPGRRLPTHGELLKALPSDQIQLAPGGELTSDIVPSASEPGRVDVIYVTDELGSVGLTPGSAAGAKAYRCVADPLN